MKHDLYYAIGLMSGTSMDGVDAALILTDGHHQIDYLNACFIPYSPEFQKQLKIAEALIAKQEGAYKPEQRLADFDVTIHDTIHQSTEYHAQAVDMLRQNLSLDDTKPCVIGYHGQTFYHQPQKGVSVILGYPDILASRFNVPVVYDFRANDIVHGGMGAPLAPIYHYALTVNQSLQPAVIINCGGISNATYVQSDSLSSLCAFDIGPGNTLIDQLVRIKTQGSQSMDQDGQFAQSGECLTDLFPLLMKTSCLQDGFYERKGAKALDIHDLCLPDFILDLSIYDGCATLAGFTGYIIAKALEDVSFDTVILGGGGWKNPAILNALKQELKVSHPYVRIDIADAFNMRSQSMEAELMGYLAVRSLKNLPISFSNTTGAPYPISGGRTVSKTL
ncbi:MAG: anhydro-N-acetylmuramic acid kinase [Alphaproteobacteria bacterium]|nr:anhydro-N-acetylmuramic acid kinase [Alphaproteobacteria bacterium]